MSQQITSISTSASITNSQTARNTLAVAAKKRKSSSDNTDNSQPSGDHRKRRRNRTTQSCLNCHGSKRMCDRKRPACGRCVKLGLSGICVYEVDDLSQRFANTTELNRDETAHLKSRIAELEGFIREFKKKPHPKWAAELLRSPALAGLSGAASNSEKEAKTTPNSDANDTGDDQRGASSPVGSLETPSTSRDRSFSNSTVSLSSPLPATPRESAQQDIPILLTTPPNGTEIPSFLFTPQHQLSDSGRGAHSPAPFLSLPRAVDESDELNVFLSVGSGLHDGDDLSNPGPEDDLERVFAQILQCDIAKRPPALHIPPNQRLDTPTIPAATQVQKCQCARKSSAYSVILELAPHIRRALDALSALPEHGETNDTCDYFKRLQHLEMATSTLVESISNSLTLNVPSTVYATPLPSPLTSTFPPPSVTPLDFLTKHAWSCSTDSQSSSSATVTTSGLKPPSSNHPTFLLPAAPSGNLWMRDSPGADYHNGSSDRFMSWDPSSSSPAIRSVNDWPRTIAL